MSSKTLHKALAALTCVVVMLIGSPKASGQTASEFAEWLYHYTSGNLLADYSGDGALSPADFSSFIQFHTSGAGDDDVREPPTTPGGGWTDPKTATDTRYVYVSSSGRDSNDGRSAARPVRTIAKGVELLRDGYPDWLLIRRGDTFYEPLANGWWKSGRSSTYPMVVSTYGEGPRPRLIVGDSSGLSLLNSATRRHLVFMGLHLEPGAQYRYEKTGMNFVGANISDVLIEDCFIIGFQKGLIIQGFGGRLADFRVRRNIIVDNSGSTHSQGFFSSNTDGLLIEENVFDRNGWNPASGRDATAGIFAHNLYIQRTNTGVIFRNNWTSRAAAEGYKSRAGGDVQGNIFVDNPIAVSFGNDGSNRDDRWVTGEITSNVVIGTLDINRELVRGWGIRVEHVAEVDITDNIVVHAASDWGFGIALRSERDTGLVDNVLIENNVVHNHGTGLQIDEELVLGALVESNIFTSTQEGEPLVDLRRGTLANTTIRGNQYRHDSSSRPFEDGPQFQSFTEWRADNDRSAQFLYRPYQDREADLDDYARSIGLSSKAMLYQVLRGQRRGNWNEDLTPQSMQSFFERAYSLQ